jgi:Bacterial regulatory proteins, tetR family
MKVSGEQVAEHRLQILAAAARLFRLRGFEGVTVAEVMKEAGLTHGAFMDTAVQDQHQKNLLSKFVRPHFREEGSRL